MFSRALILASSNKSLKCDLNKSNKLCSKLKDQTPKWNDSKFWSVIGPSDGCEKVDNFQSRIAIDFKLGQIQIGRRKANGEYLRFGIDLCSCKISVQSGLGYKTDTPKDRHAEAWQFLIEQENTQTQNHHTLTSSLVKQVHKDNEITVTNFGFCTRLDQ